MKYVSTGLQFVFTQLHYVLYGFVLLINILHQILPLWPFFDPLPFWRHSRGVNCQNSEIWLHLWNSSYPNYYKYEFLARMVWERLINGALKIPFYIGNIYGFLHITRQSRHAEKRHGYMRKKKAFNICFFAPVINFEARWNMKLSFYVTVPL